VVRAGAAFPIEAIDGEKVRAALTVQHRPSLAGVGS